MRRGVVRWVFICCSSSASNSKHDFPEKSAGFRWSTKTKNIQYNPFSWKVKNVCILFIDLNGMRHPHIKDIISFSIKSRGHWLAKEWGHLPVHWEVRKKLRWAHAADVWRRSVGESSKQRFRQPLRMGFSICFSAWLDFWELECMRIREGLEIFKDFLWQEEMKGWGYL